MVNIQRFSLVAKKSKRLALSDSVHDLAAVAGAAAAAPAALVVSFGPSYS